jgi:hypothetical protein
MLPPKAACKGTALKTEFPSYPLDYFKERERCVAIKLTCSVSKYYMTHLTEQKGHIQQVLKPEKTKLMPACVIYTAY